MERWVIETEAHTAILRQQSSWPQEISVTGRFPTSLPTWRGTGPMRTILWYLRGTHGGLPGLGNAYETMVEMKTCESPITAILNWVEELIRSLWVEYYQVSQIDVTDFSPRNHHSGQGCDHSASQERGYLRNRWIFGAGNPARLCGWLAYSCKKPSAGKSPHYWRCLIFLTVSADSGAVTSGKRQDIRDDYQHFNAWAAAEENVRPLPM